MPDPSAPNPADHAAQQLEDLYRRAIEAVGAVPYYLDYATDAYLFMGEGILQLTGYTAQEVTPDLLGDIEEESQLQGAAADLPHEEAIRLARAGKIGWRSDSRIRTRDGQTRWLADASVEILDAQGVSTGSVGILQDITARKQAEIHTQTTAQQLSALNEIGRSVATAREVDTLLDLIRAQVERSVPLDVFGVCLFSPDTQRLSFPLMYEQGRRWQIPEMPLAAAPRIGRVLHSGEALMEFFTEAELAHYRQRPELLTGDTTQPCASFLFVPLVNMGQVFGALTVQSYRRNAYTAAQLEFLQGVAMQASIAIENARLYAGLQAELAERTRAENEARALNAELQQRVALLTALHETGLDLSTRLDLPVLLRIIVERTVRLLAASMGELYLLTPDGAGLALVVNHNLHAEYTVPYLALGEGVTGQVAQTGLPLIIADYKTWAGRVARFAAGPYRAMLSVPILWQGAAVGVINVVDERPNRFTARDVEPVQQLAAHAAGAIQNARLLEDTHRQLDELTALHTIAAAAVETTDENILIAQAVQAISAQLYSEIIGVGLVDEATGALRPHRASRGLAEALFAEAVPETGVVGQVAVQGRAWRIDDVRLEPAYRATSPRVLSELCVPLKAGERLLGVINLESERLAAFSAADERLLVTIAGQLATALERLRAQAELRQLNVQLETRVQERTAQLEALNRELESFSFSVSHDLRAPLRAMRSFTEIVRQDYAEQLPAEAMHYLDRVARAGQDMSERIDALLAFSRLTRAALHRRPIDMSALAHRMLELLRAADPHRAVTCVVAEGLTAVADETLMGNVLDNLLGNAWKYSSKTPNARIEMGADRAPGQTTYWVRDNGAGFNMQYADKLFGAFQRLHASHEFPGHGVGLATVKRIIERHGGRIWAEAAVGHGATFYFTLPT